MRLPPPPRELLSRPVILLVALAAVLALAYGLGLRHGVALSDEYVYVLGARYFADTGSLDARFYSANAILAQGHPHHDMHPPGYVLLLGAVTKLLPFGYWSAVILNVVAYAAGALAVRSLGRSLGVGDGAATAAAVLFLFLPGYLPYVYWALPEVVVGALLVGVAAAAGRARSLRVAAVTGAAFALALLVRESVIFGLPAILVLCAERKRWKPFCAAAAALVLAVYVPLSRHRAEGGTNFWRSTATDSAFAFDAIGGLVTGVPRQALEEIGRRFAANRAVVSRDFSATERAILAVFVALPALCLLRWPRLSAPQRRYLVAAGGGFLALVLATALLFAVPPWSGARYLMLFPPLFLPLLTGGLLDRWTGRLALACAVAVGLGLDLAARRTFDDYKTSRQDRQRRLADYVDERVGRSGITCVVLENGWLFGLRHYPAEVLTTPPPTFEDLHLLQRALWFDYVVTGPRSELASGLRRSARYVLVNPSEPEAPLLVYRRLR